MRHELQCDITTEYTELDWYSVISTTFGSIGGDRGEGWCSSSAIHGWLKGEFSTLKDSSIWALWQPGPLKGIHLQPEQGKTAVTKIYISLTKPEYRFTEPHDTASSTQSQQLHSLWISSGQTTGMPT